MRRSKPGASRLRIPQMSKGDKEWLLAKTDLSLRLGREPTDKEIQLDLDIKLIDRAGGSIDTAVKGKHKKRK